MNVQCIQSKYIQIITKKAGKLHFQAPIGALFCFSALLQVRHTSIISLDASFIIENFPVPII